MVVPIIPMPITINIPPVDLKNIIDKTVEFVNKGGSAFEATIVQKGKDNPTFGFIKPGHPFHNYYRWKLSELKAASAPPVAPPAPADKAPEPTEAPKPIVAAPTVVSKVAAPPPKLIKPSHSEPPPPLEFYLNLPNISAQELDIMRLTAQFVARNGQAFHHGLLNRENRNPQFDFLKHNHPLNIIFSAYVNCYSRVLLPSRDTIEKLKTPQYREKAAILERAVSHMEWEQGQERARKQAEEEEDNERLAMALIDWHDFVIVETIEPFDGETDLPPPATEDQLLAGIMPAAPEVVDIAPVETEMETDEMEMEADMEEEEQPAGPAPSATPRPAAVEIEEAPSSPIIPEEPATVPLPPPDTKLKILKEPIKRPDTSKKNAMMMVCPRCNQLVREDEYNEHMRIELLDPKFSKMQRELEQRRKDAFAPSNSDSFGNLSKLAKHRSDIFGGAETEIGKVVGEEGKAAPEKVIWDGHSGSIPRTTSAALAGASLQEPVLSASGGSEKPSIGPHSVSNPSVSAVPMRQPIITVVGGSSSVPRPVIAPVVSAPLMGMPPGMMPPMMPYGVPPHMVPGMMPIPGMFAYGAPPPGMHIPPPPEDEPNSKRQKIEELNLIPEEKFLADYPSAIDLLVQVPSAPSDKNEWNFQGQQIPMTFQPTATIQAVKDRIKEELGMPPNKQKLKTPHISILKDNLSLAYYNITPGTLLVLGAKERGGRKK